MVTHASPEFVRAFAESMPEGYRAKYGAAEIAGHARVAAARDGKIAHVGFFDSARGGPAMCVVAADRPGLLSTISAAFLLCGLDVKDAEAFTRKISGGTDEAVDLFWLRPRDRALGAITDEDALSIRDVLVELLEGKKSPEEIVEKHSSAAPATAASTDTVVRFLDDRDGGLLTLEVETTDRSGLLLALSTALFQQRVQIVRSEVRTVGDRVLDRFAVVEFDGAPISPSRRLQLQVAVLNAVEPARRSAPSNRPDAR